MPARTSAQRRFHTKTTHIVRGDLTTDAPLWGDTGGHTGTAPTNLRYTFTRNPPNDINHPRTIHPNETRKQSTQHIGGGNASRTPAPILKIKKCVYRYDFGATVDDVICFKTNYSLGVTVDDAICFKTSYSLGVPWMTPFVLKQVILSVSHG